MNANPEVDVLNDRRLRAHHAALELLCRAEAEGRDPSGEERAAIARADAIIDATRRVRDDIVRHDDAIRTLEGIGEEFRRLDAAPTYQQTRTLHAFHPRRELSVGQHVDLDL